MLYYLSGLYKYNEILIINIILVCQKILPSFVHAWSKHFRRIYVA